MNRVRAQHVAPVQVALRPEGLHFIADPKKRAVEIRKIISDVAREAEVTVAQLVGAVRQRPIVEARQYAYWLAWLTGASLVEIGREFNYRNHATVDWGIKRHQRRMARP